MEQKLSQKLFHSLSDMPSAVSEILNLFTPANLNWKPTSWDGIPGERFSALEQVCHLRDIEKDGYQKRILAILNEENPVLPSLEGYELSVQRNYKDANLAEVISDFQVARRLTLAMIADVTDSQWDRMGYFEGYGSVTLRSLLHFLCSHDFEHLGSLRWLLGKLEVDN